MSKRACPICRKSKNNNHCIWCGACVDKGLVCKNCKTNPRPARARV